MSNELSNSEPFATVRPVVVQPVFVDVVALGAVDVSEFTVADLQGLRSWTGMQPLEARRLSTALGSVGAAARH